MTRILHVLDHSLPLHSGYTFRTRAILKAQIENGLDVRAITGFRHNSELPKDEAPTGSPLDEEMHDGLTFHRTPGLASGPTGLREWGEVSALANAIVQLAQKWRPDVLHAHSPALCGLAAIRAGKALGIPVVYEIRAFWEDAAVGNLSTTEGSLRYKVTRRLENYVVGRADAIMTICSGLRDDLIERGYSAEKIGIMPNGVDLEMFGEPLARDSALADELGLGDGPIIGFIGSFYDYEGLDDLIAAMPELISRHKNAKLLMVGGGPRADDLRKRTENSSVSEAICFTGRVPHDQVERYYSLCDIMAYPRKKSRLTDLVTPLKPLEAMAQGALVAASDIGGHRELITHGETGTLFAPDDAEECALALASLLDKKSSWESIRAAGRAHVENNHNWLNNAKRYHSVYQALLDPVKDSRVPRAA